MNLLLISDVYFPRVNGVSTSIRTFARALAKMGHAVTIVAPDYSGDGIEGNGSEGDGDYEIIRLPGRRMRRTVALLVPSSASARTGSIARCRRIHSHDLHRQ